MSLKRWSVSSFRQDGRCPCHYEGRILRHSRIIRETVQVYPEKSWMNGSDTCFRGQIYDFLQPFPEFGRQGTGILSFPVIQKGRIPVRMASGQFLILINRLTEHSDAEFLEILQMRLIYFRKSIRIRKIFCTFAPFSCPDKKEVKSRKHEDETDRIILQIKSSAYQ